MKTRLRRSEIFLPASSTEAVSFWIFFCSIIFSCPIIQQVWAGQVPDRLLLLWPRTSGRSRVGGTQSYQQPIIFFLLDFHCRIIQENLWMSHFIYFELKNDVDQLITPPFPQKLIWPLPPPCHVCRIQSTPGFSNIFFPVQNGSCVDPREGNAQGSSFALCLSADINSPAIFLHLGFDSLNDRLVFSTSSFLHSFSAV